ERHVLTLLPALAARGLEPAFVGLDDTAGAPDPFYEELGRSGVPFVRLPCPRDLDPGLAARAVGAVRSFAPALLPTLLVRAHLFGALVPRVPLVSTKHNDDRFRLGPFRYAERLLARRAARVIAITEALRRFNVERVGLPARKVEVVHYGLDELPAPWAANPELPLPEGARILVSIARLAE